jgi:hypothetical protein
MKKAAGGFPPTAGSKALRAYFELPEPLDEAPPLPGVLLGDEAPDEDAPPAPGVLLGDEVPDEEAPPALGELPEELLPLDGDVDEPELRDGLVAELLPEEDGEGLVAVEPLLGGLLEPLLLEPELSHATSDAADRKAAAISHLLSIASSPYGFTLLRPPEPRCFTVTPITERRRQKFRARFSSHLTCGFRLGRGGLRHRIAWNIRPGFPFVWGIRGFSPARRIGRDGPTGPGSAYCRAATLRPRLAGRSHRGG